MATVVLRIFGHGGVLQLFRLISERSCPIIGLEQVEKSGICQACHAFVTRLNAEAVPIPR
tara:strand:+ start:155 stop:334 length:180 start_codon:yes stop_codon:yes gene_type:complete